MKGNGNGAMGRSTAVAVASNDFYKTNGLGPDQTGATAGTVAEDASMTRQEFAAECDINTIMRQYDSYLSDPMRSIRPPSYVDFTVMPDTLMGAMAVFHEGEAAFMTLPAEVRKEFDNDPVRFVEFAADPENLTQMRDWGLAAPEKAPDAPLRVEVINQPDTAWSAPAVDSGDPMRARSPDAPPVPASSAGGAARPVPVSPPRRPGPAR